MLFYLVIHILPEFLYLWLIDYLRFYVPLKNISLIWRCYHCRCRAAKSRPMLGAQGLWAGMDLYRATPAVTRDLNFSGLMRSEGPSHSVTSYDTQGDLENLFLQVPIQSPLTTYKGMWRNYSNLDDLTGFILGSLSSSQCDLS
jgi:hypothetical protein